MSKRKKAADAPPRDEVQMATPGGGVVTIVASPDATEDVLGPAAIALEGAPLCLVCGRAREMMADTEPCPVDGHQLRDS